MSVYFCTYAFVQGGFNGACGDASCHDGALINFLVQKRQWLYHSHPLDVCALYHNPNWKSCALTGGVYYDSLDYSLAGCYDMAFLPISSGNINWENFILSEFACVCDKYDKFSQLFVMP